jgi:hypothetical protein
MHKDVLSFNQVRIDQDFLKEIWLLDPRTLENIDGAKLSAYALALSQYIVFLKFQCNETKAEIYRLTTYIERSISLALTDNPKLAREHGTKKAATEVLISTREDLMASQTKLEALKLENMKTEGMDKAISELIATIKRELTRRENELYQVRMARK